MTTNPTKRPLVLLVVAAAAVLVLGGVALAIGPRLEARPDPAPVGVGNDSDAAATVAVVGANGNAFFVVPAHALGTVSSPAAVGEVRRMVAVRAGCSIPDGGALFGNGSGPFSAGGQMLIRDGAFSGWTSRLPAEWAVELAPMPAGVCAGS
jgi:hypothetical protein